VPWCSGPPQQFDSNRDMERTGDFDYGGGECDEEQAEHSNLPECDDCERYSVTVCICET
jgi:hypothetical protein